MERRGMEDIFQWLHKKGMRSNGTQSISNDIIIGVELLTSLFMGHTMVYYHF